MNFLVYIGLALVAMAGTVVVFTREPGRQAVTLSFYGIALAVLFVLMQAPDVALSQVVVGTAIVPLMVLLTVRKVRR